MPPKKDPRRFIFRGNASAISGRILNIAGEPRLECIPGPPAASLTVAGGRSRAASKGAEFLDIYKWGATLAESVGEMQADGSYVTTVRASVSGVVARNKPFEFAADSLSATLVSVHRPDAEARITARGISFGGPSGLNLEGLPIGVEFDDDISAFPTFSEFERAYRKDQAFFAKHRDRMGLGEVRFGSKLPRLESGYVQTSIVRSLTWKKRKIEGHVLRLKGFGRLYFGELLLNEHNRRLTMLRLAMGSEVQAEVGLAEVDPNGIWGG